MAKQTKEEFIEAWIDKYMENHPDEKITDFAELREQADCEWYDNQVDHDEQTEYDLTAEQKKVAQDFCKGARAVNAYGKTVKRERKPNEDKRDIIAALDDGLLSYLGDDNGNGLEHTEVVNVERQIDFEWKGIRYSVTLTAHRPPKK